MPTPKLLTACLLAGLLSAVLCWAGGSLLGDESLLNKPFPGIVLGLALFGLGEYLRVTPTPGGVWTGLILIVFSVIGWRLSINVGYEYGQPIPYVAAGAVGGFTVALGTLLAWRISQSRVRHVLLITAAGAFGGLVFQVLEANFKMADDIWVLVLFLEWQSILMLGIGLALSVIRQRI